MERHNTDRKNEQKLILDEALAQLSTKDIDSLRIIVLSNQSWNKGVVGIVAGNICRTFGKPTIVLDIDKGNRKSSWFCEEY